MPLPVDFFHVHLIFSPFVEKNQKEKLSVSFFKFSFQNGLGSNNCAHKVNENIAERGACVQPSSPFAEPRAYDIKLCIYYLLPSNHLIFISALFKFFFWFTEKQTSSPIITFSTTYFSFDWRKGSVSMVKCYNQPISYSQKLFRSRFMSSMRKISNITDVQLTQDC